MVARGYNATGRHETAVEKGKFAFDEEQELGGNDLECEDSETNWGIGCNQQI